MFYASHAGMLRYLSEEFRSASHLEPDSGRFSTYATMLENMASDLLQDSAPDRRVRLSRDTGHER